jgi:hypothetical protein
MAGRVAVVLGEVDVEEVVVGSFLHLSSKS